MYRGDFSETYMGGGNTHTETKLDSLQQLHEYKTAQFQNTESNSEINSYCSQSIKKSV